MKRFLIATHRSMAEGMYDTIKFFTGEGYDIRYLSAYLNDNEISGKLLDELTKIDETEQLIIFTDISSGSVTQKFYPFIDQEKIFLVSGINLPLILSVVLSTEKEFTGPILDQLVEDAKQQIIQIKPLEKISSDDE